MHLEQKMTALSAVYDVYDRVAAEFQVACRKHCAVCCTDAVTLTTLEGYHVIQSMPKTLGRQLERGLARRSAGRGFQPELTINAIARRCADGKAIPPEPDFHEGGQCPLLDIDICPIYERRPFACRCMMSSQACESRGYASMDPFVLTLNNLFLQAIEHIDTDGCTGKLTDVLGCLSSAENRRAYRNRSLCCPSHRLARNTPLTVLMIPPSHRQRIKPVLTALQSIQIPS